MQHPRGLQGPVVNGQPSGQIVDAHLDELDPAMTDQQSIALESHGFAHNTSYTEAD